MELLAPSEGSAQDKMVATIMKKIPVADMDKMVSRLFRLFSVR